jgi:hypothetical protein
MISFFRFGIGPVETAFGGLVAIGAGALLTAPVRRGGTLVASVPF